MSLESLYRPQPGERIIMVLRPHPFTLVPSIILFIIAAVGPIAGVWLLFGGLPAIASPFLNAIATIGAATYYLCLWMFLFTQFVTFYLDTDIVTDRRIVHAVQGGLFQRTVAELDLARVQDVTSEVKGFIPTMLNYGNVNVQTAGDVERFIFDRVPDPHEVRERVLELSHTERRSEGKEMVGEALRQEP